VDEIVEQVLSYLRGIWRQRWYALGAAWLVCLCGWAIIYTLSDKYQSSARVYIDTETMLRPLLRGMTVQIDPDAQIDLMTRTLLSRPNLEKVARVTDLDLQAKNEREMDDLLNGLKKKITLNAGGREDIYTITAIDTDPQLARKVVQSVLTLFVENTLGEQRNDADSAQRFLDRQIGEYEARLREAENRLMEFKRRNMGMLPGSEGGYYNQMLSAKGELEAARLELQQAQNRQNALRKQLKENTQQQTSADVASATYVALPIDTRIQSHEQALDELLLKFTEKHPDIIGLRRTIAQLKREREQEVNQYRATTTAGDGETVSPGLEIDPVSQELRIALGQEEGNIAALQVRVKEYKRRVADLESKMDMVPTVEAEMKALNRDYDTIRQNYQALLARREQVRLSQDADQTTDDIRFRIVEPPRVPLEPASPNRPLFATAVLGLGISGGMGLAFLIAQLRPTFDTRRSVMQATRIPVLGCVGMVVSPAEARRRRFLLIAYGSLFAGLLLAYAALLVMG
jgi:polysaccharide chain length determinant protein (PEP-CTERM system associated)